jgi:hypothetical protein
MKAKPAMHRVRQEPDENQIRDYAHHLYEKSGCVPGRDLENWLEAERTLTVALQQSSSNHRRRDSTVTVRELGATPVEAHNLAQ